MYVYVKYDFVLWKKWILFNMILKRVGLINFFFLFFLGFFKMMFLLFFKYLFYRVLSIWFIYFIF